MESSIYMRMASPCDSDPVEWSVFSKRNLLTVAVALLMGETEGEIHEERELDLFYDDCSKYETDLFGGPVCGSDGTTYRNQVHLSCLNHHNKKANKEEITITSHGSCPGEIENSGCPWNPLYQPVCGSDNRTYCNKEWLLCYSNNNDSELKMAQKGECSVIDPCLADIIEGPPVCASNGLTYRNAEAVRCLRSHHADLEIVHEGGCTVKEVQTLCPTRKKVCEISKHHHENNPVCGPKNITYGNPFIFLCVNPLAGTVMSGGSCNSEIHMACRKAVQLDRKHEECKKNSKFYEVCGNDGLTYRSIDHLSCASKNNSELTLLHDGPCTWQDSPCVRCKNLDNTKPVCGSDGTTYASFVALSCVARTTDPSLRFVHVGVCVNKKTHGCYGSECS